MPIQIGTVWILPPPKKKCSYFLEDNNFLLCLQKLSVLYIINAMRILKNFGLIRGAIGTLLLFVMGMLASGCSHDEPKEEPVLDFSSIKGKIRTPEQASSIALAFLNASCGAESRTTPSVKNVETIYDTGSRGEVLPLIYAVNLEDEEGYVLISTALGIQPVLAYIDEGNYAASSDVENPGFAYFMQQSKEYVASALGSGGTPGGDTFDTLIVKRPYSIYMEAKPKLEVRWGQNAPEGTECPNGTCGCVQTAMAQILSYFELPQTIKITYKLLLNPEITLDWKKIKKHKQSFPFDIWLSVYDRDCEGQHYVLAQLCRELGKRNNAIYYDPPQGSLIGSTGANSESAYNLFKTLLPTKSLSEFKTFGSGNFKTLISLMANSGAIAYFRGQTEEDGGGHAWVCEGGRIYEYHTAVILDNGEEDVRTESYFYFNWGQNGSENGYFYGGVYDTTQGKSEDELPTPYAPLPVKSRSDFKYKVKYFTLH